MAGIEVLKGIGEDEGSSKNLKDLIKILSKEGETKRISSLSTEQFDFVFTLYSKYLIYFRKRKSAIPELVETYMDLAVSETKDKDENLLQLIKGMHQAQIVQEINEKK